MQGYGKLDEEGIPQDVYLENNLAPQPYNPNYQPGSYHLPSAVNQPIPYHFHQMQPESIGVQPRSIQFSSALHMPAHNTNVSVNTGSGKECSCCCCSCPYKACCLICCLILLLPTIIIIIVYARQY